MTYGELKRKLKKSGCYIKDEGANHEIWYSPITRKSFTVGRHNKQEVASGTLRNIKKISGIE